MSVQIEREKISTHKRTRNQGMSGTADRPYCPKALEGLGMYVFKIGSGSSRISVTKHCTEAEADAFVKLMS